MHSPKHQTRLNKKEKANQIPMLIFLCFLTGCGVIRHHEPGLSDHAVLLP